MGEQFTETIEGSAGVRGGLSGFRGRPCRLLVLVYSPDGGRNALAAKAGLVAPRLAHGDGRKAPPRPLLLGFHRAAAPPDS